MNSQQYSIYIKALAVYAQIEGMKAENELRRFHNQSPAYTEDAFSVCVSTLNNLSIELQRAA